MRTCDEALELISAALDGALTGEERSALDEHLSRCPACSALFDELKSLREACAALEDVPAPEGFAGRVMNAVAAAPAQEQPGDPGSVVSFPAKKRSRAPWKGWAATAAVVAVVALGALALPGQLGGNSKSSSGATADCAAPAQAENTGAASAGEGDAEEPGFFSAQSADDNGTLRTGGGAQPESAADQFDEDAAQSVPTGGDSAAYNSVREKSSSIQNTTPLSSPEPSAAVCGTITLTDAVLPAGLEDYSCTEDADGVRTYEVPAAYFFSCLSALEEEQPDGFAYEAGTEDAGYGLIVVGGAP